MADKRTRFPARVRDALQSYLKKTGLDRRLGQAQVVWEWPRLVGPQIAAVTEAEAVTPDGTLFVRVATSAWMNELQLMAPEIMARINAGRAAGRIERIRWFLAR